MSFGRWRIFNCRPLNFLHLANHIFLTATRWLGRRGGVLRSRGLDDFDLALGSLLINHQWLGCRSQPLGCRRFDPLCLAVHVLLNIKFDAQRALTVTFAGSGMVFLDSDTPQNAYWFLVVDVLLELNRRRSIPDCSQVDVAFIFRDDLEPLQSIWKYWLVKSTVKASSVGLAPRAIANREGNRSSRLALHSFDSGVSHFNSSAFGRFGRT